MAQNKQTSELAQLFENLSHEAMIDRAKVEFQNRIEKCKNYYDSDADDSDNDVEYHCCAKHNRLCQYAMDKYDMIKLLQTAETWYKELHCLELDNETFLELFIKSLPDNVYVLLDHVEINMYGSCCNCDENTVKGDNEEHYNFYTSVGLVSLAECFCSKCGDELLYSDEENKYNVTIDCECEGDNVILLALKQAYCKQCQREFIYNVPNKAQ
nr:hypothetical protein [Alphabaculovirus mabrassicae]